MIDPGGFPGTHRTAGRKNGRDIEAHCPHQHTGNDLVAVRNADHRVERMGGSHGLDAVGDDLAAGKGVFHAGVAHGDAVADRDGVEFIRNSARFTNGVADDLADLLEVAVAGNNVGVGVADSDEGFPDVGTSDAGCHHQSAVRRTLQPFLHDVASHGESSLFTKNYWKNG